MEYRHLGKTGIKVSEISFGTWLTVGESINKSAAKSLFMKALDLGINFFDTADAYAKGESEKVIAGELLTNVRRQDIVLATKCYFPMSDKVNDRGLSRKHIMESCHDSLRRLGTDYIDLYQCHRYDQDTPLEETVTAMDDLVHQGKILYWGVSQWSARQIVESIHISERYNLYKPVSNQPLYNIIDRSLEVDVLDVCHRSGLGLVIYSPLAHGILTGKYSGGKVPKNSRADSRQGAQFMLRWMTNEWLNKVDRLKMLAEKENLTMARFALAWCLRHPALSSLIIGATNPEQLVDNASAAGVKLSPETIEAVDEIMANYPLDQYSGNKITDFVPFFSISQRSEFLY